MKKIYNFFIDNINLFKSILPCFKNDIKTIFVLIFIFLVSNSLVAQWTAETRITNAPDSSLTPANNARNIATKGDSIFFTWSDKRDGNMEIYYKRSFNAGLLWGPDVRLTNNSARSINPSISVTGNYIYISWIDTRDGNAETYFLRSSDAGSSWGSDVRLTNDPANSFVTSITSIGLNVGVVWDDQRNGSTYEIYYKRSTDGGTSWSSDIRMTNNSVHDVLPSILYSGSIAHLIFQEGGDNWQIYYLRSSDAGNTWGSPVYLTNYPAPCCSYGSFYPSFTVSNSILHVVFHDNYRVGNSEIYYKRSTNEGISFEPEIRLTYNSGTSEAAFIAASGSNVHIVWNDDPDGNPEIYYKHSTDGGNTWGSDIPISNNSAISKYPSISISGNVLNVLWADNRDGNFEIYSSRNPTGISLDYKQTLNGVSPDDRFGFSVSSAGDVNGDGYQDVMCGSPYRNSQQGRVTIFFGGPSMDNIADIILDGGFNDVNFGHSCSSAGDVNGDGYDDVIVGSYRSLGRAYIYFGGSSMNNVADLELFGDVNYIYFGISVSGAGDVNNDGYDDVIVAASAYTPTSGRAYIYYGGLQMNSVIDLIIQNIPTSSTNEMSVSNAGDVNGDNYSDVIVGTNLSGIGNGNAYIYYGGASMNNTSDVTMTGESFNSSFGNSVSPAGDVNKDGYSDVIVGSPGYNSNTGRAYIFFGSQSMNNSADVTLTGDVASGEFGSSVSNAGDVNNDGYSDVIVGSPKANSSIGKSNIFYGSSSMNNISDVVSSGESSSNFYGSVSDAGDLNGDDCSDVIIGAYGCNAYTGRAYIYFSPMPYTAVYAKLIPEGFYNTVLNNLNQKDTIKAYMHNLTSPFQVVDSAVAVFDSITFISKFKFYNTLNGTYYLKVKHRNSIETWSKSGGVLVTKGYVANYDFTSSAMQAYGNNLKLKSTKYCIFSGDVNQDGTVDLNDLSAIDNDAYNLVSGYIVTDLDGNDFVDLDDLSIADNNAFNFVSKMTP